MPLQGYPDGQPRSFPNHFAAIVNSTSTVLGSTSPTAGFAAFGFNASLVKLRVDAGTAYVALNSTGLATTGDFKMTTDDLITDFYGCGGGIAGLSFTATSTSAVLRIGAWGG